LFRLYNSQATSPKAITATGIATPSPTRAPIVKPAFDWGADVGFVDVEEGSEVVVDVGDVLVDDGDDVDGDDDVERSEACQLICIKGAQSSYVLIVVVVAAVACAAVAVMVAGKVMSEGVSLVPELQVTTGKVVEEAMATQVCHPTFVQE
jgi:hypothetical protein